MSAERLFPGLSDADRERLLAIGPDWARDIVANRKAVLDIYTLALAARDAEGIEAARDLAYGAHERHRLDVYRKPGTANAPVILFVHGGAFLRGNKDATPQIYGNVPRYFARHGCIGVNMEYRLAPEAAYPAGTADVALAMAWLCQNIESYGGDAAKIFLIGHSAGGAHAAAYVCDPVSQPASWLASQAASKTASEAASVPAQGHGVAGLVLISARLRADALPGNPNAQGVRAYYGEDESLYEARSVVTHAAAIDVPLFLAVAEYENPGLDVYAAEMLYRVSRANRRSPRFLRLAHHNHTSMEAHFDTEEDRFGLEILDFMARGA